MDRRTFLKNAFSAGVVAVAPHAYLKLVDDTVVEEKVVQREIDFGAYDAVLLRDDKIIAYSNIADISLNITQDLIDITSVGGWKEYLPGPQAFTITMDNVIIVNMEDMDPQALLERVGNLRFMARDRKGDMQYEGDCLLTSVISGVSMSQPISFNLELRGSGALTLTDIKG